MIDGHIKPPWLIWPATVFMLMISACGDSSSGGGTTTSDEPPPTDNVDANAPTATITFPPSLSLTDGDSVIVHGTANDAEGSEITIVRVNGIDVSSNDNFATWQVTVPLTSGQNTLTVETGDMALNSNTNAATAVINRQSILLNPVDVAIDSDNNRALVIDNALRTLMVVDLTAGPQQGTVTTITDPNNTFFNSLQGIVLDDSNNRALVVDSNADAVIAVDLNPGPGFGNETVISNPVTPNNINSFVNPLGIALDSANNRAFVIDRGLDAVIEVDLTPGPTLGAREIISSPLIPNGSNAFVDPLSIALDFANSRLLVTDIALDAVMTVNLAPGINFGARSILSDSTTPNSNNPFSIPANIEMDFLNNRALVMDRGLNSLIAVDLDSSNPSYGSRTIISNNGTPNGDNLFANPRGFDLDDNANRALVADFTRRSVVAVDLNPGPDAGARTIFSKDVKTPNTDNAFFAPNGAVLDAANNRALVVDSDLRAVIAVNLTPGPNFGARSIISSLTVPNSFNSLLTPTGIVLDSNNNRALVIDVSLQAVIAVDLNPGPNLGNRSVVSNATVPDGGNAFIAPFSMVLDSANNRALVVDLNLAAVVAVDLNAGPNFGRRTIASGPTTPNNNNAFMNPVGITLDSANNRALVTDYGLDAVIAVDLTPAGPGFGARTIISDAAVPNTDNAFRVPWKITMDTNNNRALVTDTALNAIIAVNLSPGPEFGVRSILSDNNTPNTNNAVLGNDILMDSGNNRALLLNAAYRSLLAVDLRDGQRIIISR